MNKIDSKALRISLFFVAAVALVASTLVQLQASAAATLTGMNTLISVNGVDGYGGDSRSDIMSISEDGNKVLFGSTASNLPVANVGSGKWGVFMRDVAASTTVRADTSASGVYGDGTTADMHASRTGRYVVFRSLATNLIDGTTISATNSQVYLKDLQTGTITLITKDSSGTPIADINDQPKDVSDDGRFVLMMTRKLSNYVAGARNNYWDPMLYDAQTSTWQQLDVPVSGSLQNADTYAFNMSCDGSLIMISSKTTNLVSGFSGSGEHVYLVDVRKGTKLTDLNAGATAGSSNAQVSCNGRYILFGTQDRTFVSPTPSGMDSYLHLVKYDRLTGARSYIDSNTAGTTFSPGHTNYPATLGSYSANDKGDVVLAYHTPDGFGGYVPNAYLKHLSDGSGTLEHIQKSPTSGYSGLASNTQFMISPNGKYIAYRTTKLQFLGLAPNDSGQYDIVRTETGL